MKVMYGNKRKPITITGEDLYGTILTLIRANLEWGYNWKTLSEDEQNNKVKEVYFKLLKEKKVNFVLVTNNVINDKEVYFEIIEE